jgi:hypothetical protein
MENAQEDFKVIAAVEFNDGEALVLNRPIRFVYEEVGRDFVGSDGPFRDFLGYGTAGNMKAFAGRELHLTMTDGSVRKVKDNWWSTWKEGYSDLVVRDLDALKKCYVFSSAHITQENYAALRSTYTGGVFDYWDYEKVLKHEYWVNLYIKESEKVHDLKDKERKRLKRGDLLTDLLMGRSMLLHAIESAKNWQRFMDLDCSLDEAPDDHIGVWKKAIKESDKTSERNLCEDELFEVNECPKCSAMYASYKARRIMKQKLGIINGILTRMGNHMRGKDDEK